MDSIVVFCDKCQKELRHDVVELKEGIDCWLEITVKCPECNKVHTIKLYS
jgi:uncharacterized Zn finger protein